MPQEELSDHKRSDPAAQVCAGAQGSMPASTIAPSLVLCDSLASLSIPDSTPVEAAEAQRRDIKSWPGRNLLLQEWSHPRFFAVPPDRVAAHGKRAALEDLLSLATALGYQAVRDPMNRVFGEQKSDGDGGSVPSALDPVEPNVKGKR